MNFTTTGPSTKHPNAHAIASWQDSLDTHTALLHNAEKTEILAKSQLSRTKLQLLEYMDMNSATVESVEYNNTVNKFNERINDLTTVWSNAVNDVTACKEHVNLFEGKLKEAGCHYKPHGSSAPHNFHTESAPVHEVHKDIPYQHYKGMPAIHMTERHPESAVVKEAHMDAPYHHQFDPVTPHSPSGHIKGMPAIHITERHPESAVVKEAHMDAPYHQQFNPSADTHMHGMPAIHHTARHPESQVVTEAHMDAPYHHQFDGHRTFRGDPHFVSKDEQDPHPFEYHPRDEVPSAAAQAEADIHKELLRLDDYVTSQGAQYSTIVVHDHCHILKAGAGCRQQLLYSFPITSVADVKATVLSFLLNKEPEGSLESWAAQLRRNAGDKVYVPAKHHH